MKKEYKFPLIFGLILLAASQLPAQDWQLKRDKGGIKVYVRDVPGSRIKELKFTSYVEASLNSIAAVLTNVEGFDDWSYGALNSRTVEKVSDTEVYYYTEVDFPWPFENRDLVLHSTCWQDKKSLAIYSKTTSAHWLEAENDDLVRIKKAELHWSFTPEKNGKVRVDYYLNSDPGGNIPAWMVNLAADQGPLQTMIKFKEMLEKEKYKNARLAFVQDIR
jgi:hypothetical protein